MTDNWEFWILRGDGNTEEDPEQESDEEKDLEGDEGEWNVVVADDSDKEEE